MSEKKQILVETVSKAASPDGVRFRIVIEHTWSGEMRVYAPFNKKDLCYAMLKDAMKTVENYQPAIMVTSSGIVSPNGRPI